MEFREFLEFLSAGLTLRPTHLILNPVGSKVEQIGD